MNQQQKVEAFQAEWELRESLLKAHGLSPKVIQKHRSDILHRYSLTEEQIKQQEKSNASSN